MNFKLKNTQEETKLPTDEDLITKEEPTGLVDFFGNAQKQLIYK